MKWGRLLKVTDKAFTWEASYDALGRRLQTRYTPFNGAIGFTNGINNNLSQAVASAQQLSLYAQGTKIYGTYNATNNPVVDVLE
jgi:hypothetical protein